MLPRKKGPPPGAAPPYGVTSEVDLCAELHETRRQDRLRSEPGAARGERLVVGQDRIRVQDVEDIDPDVRACPAEAQHLRKTKVDLVDPIAPLLARRNQVDWDRCPRSLRRSTQNRRDRQWVAYAGGALPLRRIPRCAKWRTLVAPD